MGRGSGASGARGGGGGGNKGALANVMDAKSQRELTSTMMQRTSASNLIDSTDTKSQALKKMDNAISDVESTLSPTGRYQKALNAANGLPKGFPGRSSEISKAKADIATAQADLAAMRTVRSAISNGTKISVYTDANNRLRVRS